MCQMLPECCVIDDVYKPLPADSDSTLTKRRSFGDQYLLFSRQDTTDYMENNFPSAREPIRDMIVIQVDIDSWLQISKLEHTWSVIDLRNPTVVTASVFDFTEFSAFDYKNLKPVNRFVPTLEVFRRSLKTPALDTIWLFSQNCYSCVFLHYNVSLLVPSQRLYLSYHLLCEMHFPVIRGLGFQLRIWWG